MVRASRADAPVQVQFRVPGSLTMLDWLVTRAATLTCLERGDYPAPRLIRTRAGDPVGVDGVWLTLASTYIPGTVLQPTLDQLRMLGGAVGRLHAMDPGLLAGPGSLGAAGAGAGGPTAAFGAFGAVADAGEGAGPGRAAWYPEAAIPVTQARLDAVADLVPDDWLGCSSSSGRRCWPCRRGCDTLPRGLVHGDAWPANAVQTGRTRSCSSTGRPAAWACRSSISGSACWSACSTRHLPVVVLRRVLVLVVLRGCFGGGEAAEVWEPEAWDPSVWRVEPDEVPDRGGGRGLHGLAGADRRRARAAAARDPVRRGVRRGYSLRAGAGRGECAGHPWTRGWTGCATGSRSARPSPGWPRGISPPAPRTRKRYAEAGRLPWQARAHSSGVEHSPYKRGAGGSNPPAPTDFESVSRL